MTGLIAMELVNHYNKPALLLRRTELDGEDVYGGSGRNGNFYGIPNLKEFLHQAGVYYVEGHASAFGCYARPNEIQKIRDYANTQLSPSAFESVYQVDYWFDNKHPVDYDMLAAFCKHKELWGNSIPQPKFAFSGSYTARDTFFMGKDKHSLKIHGQGVDFVMFKAQKIIEQFITHPEGSYLIVGRPQFNEYNGVTSVQIMIDYIELNSTQKQETTVKSLMDLI